VGEGEKSAEQKNADADANADAEIFRIQKSARKPGRTTWFQRATSA